MTKRITREITKEQYINATMNNDANGIFTDQEVCGYGVYGERYFEQDGKCFVSFCLGDSCD